MKKKHTRSKQAEIKPAPDPKALNKLKILLGIIIAVLAIILYANSLNHDFTLDDHPAIDANKITVKGIAGIPTLLKTDYWYGYKDELRGPIYRPTSLIVFAVVWQFFPNNPQVYHLVNILTYAITCLILFLVLCRLFKNYNLIFPFVCALLYTAHPIHTEVVNNIKSMDEMLCFLFAVTSILFILKYISGKSVLALAAGSFCFFLSLISKETGITFLAIIPVLLYFFTDATIKKNLLVSGILAAITGLYLILRMIVLKDIHQSVNVTASVLNNTLNAAPDLIGRYATVFYILLRYVMLLIFPHPLSCDYNFSEIKIQTLADPGALLGIILFAVLSILSIIHFRKKSILAFGFLFFVITLAPVSNFFFLGGSTMAERFMYIPSLGFCFCLAYFLIKLTKTEKIKSGFANFSRFVSGSPALFLFTFGIVLLYSFKTVSRNKDWKDNLTIYAQDIKVSENSATANKILGSSLFNAVSESPDKQSQADTFQIAKQYLKRALEIYPTYTDPLSVLGVIYYIENKFDSAYYYQKRELVFHKDDVDLNYNYGKTLNKLKKYDEAITVSLHTLALDPKHEGANYNLALAYTNKGDNDKGLYYLSKVIELNPGRGDAYYYTGLILKAKGDELKAKEFFDKATAVGYKP